MHLLPFDRLEGIGIDARVTVAPDQDREQRTIDELALARRHGRR